MLEIQQPTSYSMIFVSSFAYIGIFILYIFSLIFLVYNTCNQYIIEQKQKISIYKLLKKNNHVDVN